MSRTPKRLRKGGPDHLEHVSGFQTGPSNLLEVMENPKRIFRILVDPDRAGGKDLLA